MLPIRQLDIDNPLNLALCCRAGFVIQQLGRAVGACCLVCATRDDSALMEPDTGYQRLSQ